MRKETLQHPVNRSEEAAQERDHPAFRKMLSEAPRRRRRGVFTAALTFLARAFNTSDYRSCSS